MKLRGDPAALTQLGKINVKSRILIADDHDLVRETLACYLAKSADLDVSQSRDLDGALEQIGSHGSFDLVLLDLTMPGMTMPNGLIRCLDANRPGPVALLTGTSSEEIEHRAIMDGAADYLPKTLTPDALVARVKRILAGEVARPSDLKQADTDVEVQGTPVLTRREKDVLQGICAGRSNREIAEELDVQEVTVKLHVKTLSRKLGARNRTHAALIARDLHLI
ncbi:MAG: response regulator transcription factor [Rhodobacterales bacterium]|nr:response regulator transcription factor [Rhodobacterales bacterium]MDX5488564.1 response regulator transcription factor [Rhodobacterales bacterium]